MAEQRRQSSSIRTYKKTATKKQSGDKSTGAASGSDRRAQQGARKKAPGAARAPRKRTSTGGDSRPRRGGDARGRRSNKQRGASAHRFPAPALPRDNGENDVIPPLAPDSVRVIPLGGVEEIGRNMSMIEYGDDIVIVDCGFQFREDTTPGIDYILPNTRYLEERKEKIRGIFITHGHLDHIGGIPYIVDKIGNPPIYSRRLTTTMIKKRQEEFPHLPALNIIDVEKEETIPAGKDLKVKFFAVTHTIPDSMGIIVETPYGAIVHTGDLKLEHEDGVPTENEEKEFSRFKDMDVLMLMADSTNVERPGWSIPEQRVFENIDALIKNTPGRIIIGTFASQLERIARIIESCEHYGKKIVIEGRSMKTNVEIIKQLGMLKTKPGTFISNDEMESYPPSKIVILATGAQGDDFAALMRMSNKTHRQVAVTPKDTIILSSSVIPGNERAVQKLKDNLSRQGAHIIHYQVSDVHSSGHANRDETKWIHEKVGARFFMPLHGYHYMLRVHADVAQEAGLPEDHTTIPDNGSIIEIQDGGKKLVKLKERAPSAIRMVDGFSVGEIQDVVIRDRQMLSQDGMFVIIATINLKTGKLRKSPDIISRGFIYLRESQDLLSQSRLLIKKTVEETTAGMNPINFDYVKGILTDSVSAYLFQKTNKHPIVIPVLLGV